LIRTGFVALFKIAAKNLPVNPRMDSAIKILTPPPPERESRLVLVEYKIVLVDMR